MPPSIITYHNHITLLIKMNHKCNNCGEEADIEVKDEETKHYCSKCYFSNKKLK